MNSLNFNINDFSGPLDLLLHLVRESKMDIYEVPIEEITNQYIEFINKMETLNIEIASEYLVMASELMYIKSKRLLNIKDKEEDGEQLEFKLGTEEELRARLIEYERYKEITENFKVLEEKRGEVYTKVPESLSEYKGEVELNTDTTLDDLLAAFNQFLERQKFMKPLSTKVTTRELNVSERSKEIRNILKVRGRISFEELFENPDKPHIVVTFLSILEMAKACEIAIRQEKNFSNIIIEAK